MCRAVYNQFKNKAPRIPINEVVDFLDNNSKLKELVYPLTEEGYKTMYI